MEQQLPRQGPRPLPLHLLATLLAWQSSPAAWSAWRQGSLKWSAPLSARADALRQDLHRAYPESPADPNQAAQSPAQPGLEAALVKELQQRSLTLARALLTYRHHPYRRDLPPMPEVWRQGTTSLRDYNPSAGAAARPLLVVPSLVNRGYVLDLSAKTSLLRWLAAQGQRPFLIDWDQPGAEERRFTLTDYICGRLVPALEQVVQLTGQAPRLLGYCMGGNLALALALQRPQQVSGLALLATPWDFHAESPAQAQRLAQLLPSLSPLMEAAGELPVDPLQSLFMLLDPLLMAKKFAAFARLDPASAKAEAFVALEDWLNDGVALAAPVARECLSGWYGDNTPATGQWRIAGRQVRPADITCPTLALIPEADRIVPPASALALARAIPGAEVHTPPLGHIGMVVGGAAREKVWEVVGGWVG